MKRFDEIDEIINMKLKLKSNSDSFIIIQMIGV